MEIKKIKDIFHPLTVDGFAEGNVIEIKVDKELTIKESVDEKLNQSSMILEMRKEAYCL